MNAKPTLLDLFKADLEKAAEKAGCDLSKLEIESCYMDRTWGDRCGFFFSGEHAERAANWFYWWLTHKPLPSSYEAQRSTYQPEAWSRMVCKSNGAKSH